MAKIKFGMMMTDARGKLGGQVFSKNKAGAYIRTKVTPTNPQTSFQSSVRALFAGISAQWSGLTESVRAGWNNAVQDWASTDVFGDLKSPTGKALFQQLNNQAQSAGLPAVTSVPAKTEMPDEVTSAVDVVIGTTIITLTDANTAAGTNIVLFATGQLSAGTSFVKNKLRQIYAVSSDAYVATDAYSAYVARFGAPTAGANVHFGIKYVAPTGQATPLQQIKSTVSA